MQFSGVVFYSPLCITVCLNPLFNIIYIIRNYGFFSGEWICRVLQTLVLVFALPEHFVGDNLPPRVAV